MFSTLFATISVHKFIDNVGAYVGFASIIAVALLVLLYFAHARETATLRDRLDEAHARIGGLEQRIVQLMQAQRGRGPVPGAVAGAPAAVTQPPQAPPAGSAIPSVRRLPNVTVANGPPPAIAPPPPLVAGLAGLAPAAAVGMAGPALASATKMIPVGAPAATSVPEETMFVAPSTNGAGENGKAADDAPATAVAAAVASKPTASPRRAAPAAGAPDGPPRVQIGGGGSTPPRRSAPGSRPLLDDLGPGGGERRRLSGRLLPLLIGGVAVVVIIVGLIVITNTGGSTTTGTVNHNNNATGASVTNKKNTQPPAPFIASKFKVSVLNGTAVGGLAADVGTVITAEKFKLGNVTNAADQTESSTFVYYVSGNATAANKTAAMHVADALKLAANRVRAAGPSVVQSCATSPTGASLGGCRANVIVSVGQDRADLATSSTS